jgi:HAD superfamily hydrolase (TIGR01549 family)
LKVKAVVLDMDGTITRFNLDFMDARRRALEELDKLRLRTPDLTEEVSLYIILGKLKQRLDSKTFDEFRSRIYVILEEMELKAAKEVTLLPGAVDTLQKLRNGSFKIGLVTNNGRKGTESTLNRCNLVGFFDAIVTRDDCDDMKPNPAPVAMALSEMHASTDEAILVGDGVMDIMAAKAAGIPSVAVATGPFSSTRLLEAEPDYLLASVNDLPELIEAIQRAVLYSK